MNAEDFVIFLGTAHIESVPNKTSPDGRLKEYLYSRDIVFAIEKRLKDKYSVFVDYRANGATRLIKSPDWRTEEEREVDYRVSFVNRHTQSFGKERCLYVPIHINSNGNKWSDERGWECFFNEDGVQLAECLKEGAEKYLSDYSKVVEKPFIMEASSDYIKKISCPSCMTGNLFMDNKQDVAWLLSDTGFEALVNLHVYGIEKYINAHG